MGKHQGAETTGGERQLSSLSSAKMERAVVKDAKKFAAIFGDNPGMQVHGRVTRSGVDWQPGVALQPVFERLLAGEMRTEDRLVLIMRGFPGSGKSSLASSFAKLARAAVCISADDHWAGTDKLQEAHEACRKAFAEALAAGSTLVTVDNTNIRKADYAFYQRCAEQAGGYEVVLLEMVCDDTLELERLRKRSLHDVPGASVGGMWSRWEQDPTALRLLPFFPQRVMQWVREQSLLNRRPQTHMVMPSGPFFSVPAHLREDFHRLHAMEWGCNHIAEVGDPTGFQLFFDIDGLALEQLLPTLGALRELVQAPLLLVGIRGSSPGYHIHVPGKIVTTDAATDLRTRWLEAEPSLSLGNFVDAQLYRHPQLRLLGSRKISKDGVDTGRVHTFIGRYDAAWKPCDDDDGAGKEAGFDWGEVSIHPPLAS